MAQQKDSNRVVLVSSGQPGGNPRLVKEATALSAAGYQVTVIYCRLSPWADAYDRALFQRHQEIKWVAVGYDATQQKWKYRYARLRQKCYQKLWSHNRQQPVWAIRSMVLYSQELVAAACAYEAELFIGHNLGALPAVVAAARHFGARVAFDFEDYHRGEDVPESEHTAKTTLVENHFVPGLDYATTASPLISAAYGRHFPNLPITTINNCFPLSYRATASVPEKPLRLFWFSQFIGPKRGLETVIEALGKLPKGSVTLTLLGNLNTANRDYFERLVAQNGLADGQLQFLAPVAEEQIVGIAAQHHIGVASELPHVPNRDLCLTNKIFMYLLAGNAVLFTNTLAQQRFLQEHPGIGSCFSWNDADELAEKLIQYLANPEQLQAQRNAASHLASQTMSWEQEQKIFLQCVNKVVSPC